MTTSMGDAHTRRVAVSFTFDFDTKSAWLGSIKLNTPAAHWRGYRPPGGSYRHPPSAFCWNTASSLDDGGKIVIHHEGRPSIPKRQCARVVNGGPLKMASGQHHPFSCCWERTCTFSCAQARHRSRRAFIVLRQQLSWLPFVWF
jgi:hypothetical protein